MEATPTSTPVSTPAAPASQIVEDGGPIVWQWNSQAVPDPVFSEPFREGDYCYGNSEPPPPPNRHLTFLDGTLTVGVGLFVSPIVSYADQDGVTDLGNPFGEDEWICSVATDGTVVLAVGSNVWWSDNGTTWNLIEEPFSHNRGTGVNGSNLVWSAAGPLGYVVLGPEIHQGWFSPDLETWYRIPVDEGSGYSDRGWFGPGNVTISNEMIVIGSGGESGAWIGIPRP